MSPLLLHTLPLAMRGWSPEPGIVIPLIVLAALYARGARVLRRRSKSRGVRGWHLASFVAGWTVVALALVSPLHAWSEQSFTAHMIQHELLMALGAPLLVIARPELTALWAVPRSARQRVARWTKARWLHAAWRGIARPSSAVAVHGAAIWLWHLPTLFQATLSNELVHALQHISFLGSALLFWHALLHGQRRATRGMAIVYLFLTAVHTSVLGALITFAKEPWYPAYAGRAAAWHLTPLADQQLAGMIMWIPPSFAYLVAALAILVRWLHESDWAADRRNAPLPLPLR